MCWDKKIKRDSLLCEIYVFSITLRKKIYYGGISGCPLIMLIGALYNKVCCFNNAMDI